jgi:hypothetical protein
MGVGDLPIWAMRAERPDLPAHTDDWVLDFVVPRCPAVGGRFVVSAQLMAADDRPIAATRTHAAFEVVAEPSVGIVRVDYSVAPAVGVTA